MRSSHHSANDDATRHSRRHHDKDYYYYYDDDDIDDTATNYYAAATTGAAAAAHHRDAAEQGDPFATAALAHPGLHRRPGGARILPPTALPLPLSLAGAAVRDPHAEGAGARRRGLLHYEESELAS